MNSHPVKKNWRELFPSRTNSEHWYQSTKPGKHRNTLSQMEFVRRKIERKREGFAPCARRITKECKSKPRNKRARIRKNKESVKCFKCQGSGHFANTCPQDDTKTTQKQERRHACHTPNENVLPRTKSKRFKYPPDLFLYNEGIIDGTDKGSWDDFWYISNASNKHMTANLKFFSNLKEEFLVEKLEKQGKFLFTYGIGEVLIENEEGTYMIPGVHYAPEVTLNILSIGLLRQQGFEISSNGDRCTLAYMFKDKRGKDINLDRMREQHNNYLEDYFDVLDRSANIERRIEAAYERRMPSRDCNFQLMGGNISVQFECDFEGLWRTRIREIQWEWNIRKDALLDNLEPLVSNYKAARSSNPTGGYGDEGIRRFDGYHGDGNKDGSTAVKEKGIVKHFGITLEEEEGKYDTTAQQDEEDMARIKCYICQRMGHFDVECPIKDYKEPDRRRSITQDNKARKILIVHQAKISPSSFEPTKMEAQTDYSNIKP
ncbi:ARID DNA-binding domain-containing protein [Tanacetum coccineum]